LPRKVKQETPVGGAPADIDSNVCATRAILKQALPLVRAFPLGFPQGFDAVGKAF
jgi:hypothetical protein